MGPRRRLVVLLHGHPVVGQVLSEDGGNGGAVGIGGAQVGSGIAALLVGEGGGAVHRFSMEPVARRLRSAWSWSAPGRAATTR
jgi:hypothetical protein